MENKEPSRVLLERCTIIDTCMQIRNAATGRHPPCRPRTIDCFDGLFHILILGRKSLSATKSASSKLRRRMLLSQSQSDTIILLALSLKEKELGKDDDAAWK